MSSSASGHGGPPTISYTRKRTTTNRTRSAASSARRRRNVPLCRSSGGGGADGKDDAKDARSSWFARKSAGWTDDRIKSHLVGGDASKEESFGMVGDMIQGAEAAKGRRKRRRAGGPRFAWEEEEGEEDEDESGFGNGSGRRMAAAPTLSDIMDEKDQVDFMSPLKVGKQYQMKEPMGGGDDDDGNDDKNKSKGSKNARRRNNAALAELAQVSGVDHGGGNPTSANESIGLRLLRVCGYRSRLGMAFVPLSGHVGGKGGIDDELKELEGKTHEARWLASKRLRAIRLPSIQHVDEENNTPQQTSKTKTKVLVIPPTKINRHGIGHDPFKNAPEFREFHERRRALSRKHGRGTDDHAAAEVRGGKRGDRYFTDDLRDGRRRPWDAARDDREDGDDGSSDGGDADFGEKRSQHSHYAADRDYADLIGTKASSGFALRDEDDADVYQNDGHPRGEGVGDGVSGYAMEVQSPPGSDDEADATDGGLFGESTTAGGRAAGKEVRKTTGKKANDAPEDEGKMADAWSAWGMGTGGEGGAATKRTTMDGKPPLPGFTLGQANNISNQKNDKLDGVKRWKGPILPSGFVLKRHVFPAEDGKASKAGAVDRTDSGLGLDLQRHRRPPRSIVPRVLPPPSDEQGQRHLEKMRARDGSELNFHAVRESMKNRFVSSSAGTSDSPEGDAAAKDDGVDAPDPDKEEWVQVTVTPWMPTRLLCKRWGVPVPSVAGMSATTGDGSMGKARGEEEEYFRRTVYEPAVAGRRQEVKDPQKGLQGSHRGDEAVSTNANGGDRAVNGMILGEEEDAGPPPDRPSNDVFQAIFDAESDMDISSSDDDDDADGDEHERNGPRATVQSNEKMEEMAPNNADDEATKYPIVATSEGKADAKTKQLNSAEKSDDGEAGSGFSTDSSASSSRSQTSKERHSRRRRHHRHHRIREETDEDRKRRKRKEKNRRKHHRRRWDSASESDGKLDGHGGSEDDRRRRKKKHRHRSHSRHRGRKK